MTIELGLLLTIFRRPCFLIMNLNRNLNFRIFCYDFQFSSCDFGVQNLNYIKGIYRCFCARSQNHFYRCLWHMTFTLYINCNEGRQIVLQPWQRVLFRCSGAGKPWYSLGLPKFKSLHSTKYCTVPPNETVSSWLWRKW